MKEACESPRWMVVLAQVVVWMVVAALGLGVLAGIVWAVADLIHGAIVALLGVA